MLADGPPDALAERGDDRVVPRGMHPPVGDPGSYHPKDQSGLQASMARCARFWPSGLAGLLGLDEASGVAGGAVGGGGAVGVLDAVGGGGGGAVGVLDGEGGGGGLDGACVCGGGGGALVGALLGARVGCGVLAVCVGLGGAVDGAWPATGASPSTLAGGGNSWISRPSMSRRITEVQVSAG